MTDNVGGYQIILHIRLYIKRDSVVLTELPSVTYIPFIHPPQKEHQHLLLLRQEILTHLI